MTNWFSIVVGVLQLGAAIQAYSQGKIGMAAVFAMYGVCSIILAKV
jgi:hypothetical protein